MTPASPTVRAKASAGRLLAFDPGLIHPAAATFWRGELYAASRISVPRRFIELNRGERVRQIVKLIVQWWHRAMGPEKPDFFIGEWPKTLERGKGSKNSADQLFPLAAMSEGVANSFDIECEMPIPFEWTGNIPKDDEAPQELAWESPRGKLVKACLNAEEIARVVLSHDAVDAIGIGEWGLGKYGNVTERRYPGAV